MRKQAWLAMGLFLLLATQAKAQVEKVDMTAIQKIRDEGLQHSHVMDIAFHLTDASGNRLRTRSNTAPGLTTPTWTPMNTCAKTISNR